MSANCFTLNRTVRCRFLREAMAMLHLRNATLESCRHATKIAGIKPRRFNMDVIITPAEGGTVWRLTDLLGRSMGSITSVDVTAADFLVELDEALRDRETKLCFAQLKDPVKEQAEAFRNSTTDSARSSFSQPSGPRSTRIRRRTTQIERPSLTRRRKKGGRIELPRGATPQGESRGRRGLLHGATPGRLRFQPSRPAPSFTASSAERAGRECSCPNASTPVSLPP